MKYDKDKVRNLKWFLDEYLYDGFIWGLAISISVWIVYEMVFK